LNDFHNDPNNFRNGYGLPGQPEQPAPQAPAGDPFAAWRNPEQQPAGDSFLTDAPAPFGAELQQGGSPLFSQQDFGAMGDNAPTRIVQPVPMVTRRTTVVPAQPVGGPSVARTAYPQDPPRRRRRAAAPEAPAAADGSWEQQPVQQPAEVFVQQPAVSQPAEQQPVQQPAEPFAQQPSVRQPVRRPLEQQPAEQPMQPQAQYAPVEQPAAGPQRQYAPAGQEYDLFSAGDSEAQPPVPRRTATPGDRYVGARTAMPSAEVSVADRARQAKERVRSEMDDRNPYEPQAEPRSQQPARQSRPATARRRPVQPGQQPMREDEYAAYNAQPTRSPYDDPRTRRPSATVERARYDFEDDEMDEPRGGILVPLIIVLLVIGALLAGICLPKWDQVEGTFGSTMANLKTSVVTVFSNVKNMILPEDEPIKSFNVSTADAAAPADVRFTVQTAKKIDGIRIEDDNGFTIYSKLFSDQLVLNGEVINNSDEYIWTPTCRLEDAYSGSFTVYAQKSDGTESEGLRASGTVEIAAPKAIVPPIQDFRGWRTGAAACGGHLPCSDLCGCDQRSRGEPVRLRGAEPHPGGCPRRRSGDHRGRDPALDHSLHRQRGLCR